MKSVRVVLEFQYVREYRTFQLRYSLPLHYFISTCLAASDVMLRLNKSGLE